ncbi:MAG: hypothetical protein B6I38_04240 [Anaerolineaceae bacterium 4572_5.1]|nr:MAG: hypothetical protein B6I38_04240 [Anaerolineaceae bacterium 4572_5.1]RLD07721.1 MAG: glycoside hydrolase [Chloroflexota bacterium]
MIKKQYIKSRQVYKITFCLTKDELPNEYETKTAHLVGDFNDWDHESIPMTHLKKGDFKINIDLKPGQKYEFRYLLNGEKWFNEWEADEYVLGGFGKDNCVIEIPELP